MDNNAKPHYYALNNYGLKAVSAIVEHHLRPEIGDKNQLFSLYASTVQELAYQEFILRERKEFLFTVMGHSTIHGRTFFVEFDKTMFNFFGAVVDAEFHVVQLV